MKHFWAGILIVVSLASARTASADGCTVTGNALACNPNAAYVAADHGGQTLQSYDSVSLTTSTATNYGYGQWSGQVQFNDLTVSTSGVASDGIRLINWGPTTTIRNLTVTTTGASADGINLGRDNTDSRVTVNGTTTIRVAQGMGIRATASGIAGSVGAHIITLNGDSNIETRGNGDANSGYAVYAGNNSTGCGPLNLPLFDCKAIGPGQIFLRGTPTTEHVITTYGTGAHALFANGRGFIRANNIDIETNGNGANGIVASRVSGMYYLSSTDNGNQDYAGTVELVGNVTVNAKGTNAYAMVADSVSATNGKDAGGTTASIRSFNSATNQVVADKIYRINGDLLAKNSGVIDLSMADNSLIVGKTAVQTNGIINLNVYGSNSVWNMTGNSSLTNLSLLNSAVAYTTSAGGSVFTPKTLTVQNNYHADFGALAINAVLGDDASPADKLVVGGNTSGQTAVFVNNMGGTGAPTVAGIKVIEVAGMSGGTFALQGNATFQGEQAIVAGAYAYRLQKGSTSSATDGNWYLRSNLQTPSDPTDPGTGVTPVGSPGGSTGTSPHLPIRPGRNNIRDIDDVRDIRDYRPDTPLYQPGAPTYEAYPQILLELNGLPTLRQRVGNRFREEGAALPTTLDDDGQSATGVTASFSDTHGMWLRVERMENRVIAGTSTSGTDYDVDASRMEIGFDSVLATNDSGKLVGGVLLHEVYGIADTTWRYSREGYGAGRIGTHGYGIGGTLTWYGGNGVYVDAAAQATWYRSTLAANPVGMLTDTNNAFGHAMSVESGRRLAINDNWSVTPQIQLSYSKVRFRQFTDVFGATIDQQRNDSLQGRLGLGLDYQAQATRLYGIVNLYNEFLDGTSVLINDATLSSRKSRVWAGVGVGGQYSWANDRFSVYGEAVYNSSVASDASRGYGGTIGLRMRW